LPRHHRPERTRHPQISEPPAQKTVQGRTPTLECGLLFIQKVSPIYRLFSTFLPEAIQRK
ncbi:MAG: hypothetical protein K1V74_07445, partial [Muribaculaceae bacterium]